MLLLLLRIRSHLLQQLLGLFSDFSAAAFQLRTFAFGLLLLARRLLEVIIVLSDCRVVKSQSQISKVDFLLLNQVNISAQITYLLIPTQHILLIYRDDRNRVLALAFRTVFDAGQREFVHVQEERQLHTFQERPGR